MLPLAPDSVRTGVEGGALGDVNGCGSLRADARCVGRLQADRVGPGCREGGGQRRRRTGVGRVVAAAVEVPAVVGDRALRSRSRPRRRGSRSALSRRARWRLASDGDRAQVDVLGVDSGRRPSSGSAAVVDREFVQRAGAEQRAAVARHQVEGRVGEVALAGAGALLLVADRLAVDVGGDLAGRSPRWCRSRSRSGARRRRSGAGRRRCCGLRGRRCRSPKVPPNSPALGSTRKPPAFALKFGVNSIASASLLAYGFHFSQNSIVTLLVPERFSGMAPESLAPLKLIAVLGSRSRRAAPNVPPVIGPGRDALAVEDRRARCVRRGW